MSLYAYLYQYIIKGPDRHVEEKSTTRLIQRNDIKYT